ncbi:hypothetical protein K9U39_20395 [Rhodoblastus acidophilus]|nr:hypothetical protein [Rhodoblastus acidophilus]
MADDLADLLGVPRERLGTLTHVAKVPSPGMTRRPEERVLVPTRISPEKRFVISAAAALAQHRGVPLVVVGVGNDVPWVEEMGRDQDPVVEVLLDPDIHRHVAANDVVVGVGLVALEVAQYAGAMVTATLDGRLGDVVRASSARSLHELNFLGQPDHDGLSPADAWTMIDTLTDDERHEVRSILVEAADPARALGQLVAACDGDTSSLAPGALRRCAAPHQPGCTGARRTTHGSRSWSRHATGSARTRRRRAPGSESSSGC